MAQVTGKFHDSGSYKLNSSSGDNATTGFVLSHEPISGTQLNVYLDGVKQKHTTDYTVNLSTKTVTFVIAPAAGQAIDFKYIAKV